MFKKLVPLSREAHSDLKVALMTSFDFARDFHIASVMVNEFVRAASVYPLVFIEGANNAFRPVAMMGLDNAKNLFVTDEGTWQAPYIPAIIRRYPFALAASGQEGQFTVCVDEESTVISRAEGTPLFDDAGEPTHTIDNIKKYLAELQQMELFTNEFCDFLKANNLLTPLNMQVRVNEQTKNITGCYVVNEERFNKLNDELFMEVRKKGYLPAIYAHLTSLAQIERLAMLSSGTTAVEAGASDAVH